MKNELRHNCLQLRNSLNNEYIHNAEKLLTENFLKSSLFELPAGKSIMLYAAFKNEASTWQLINTLQEKGIKVILPKTQKGDITAYEYTGMDGLQKDGFGILSPDPYCCPKAALSEIHTVIVPGVAFDSAGNRIGFGKGYYDRFLPKIPEAVKIGLCYEFQLLPDIPASEFDVPMDWILTEERLIKCKPD